ncbi:hypothetical protein DFLDMN_001622 [Cupriavidus sp. H19C3]
MMERFISCIKTVKTNMNTFILSIVQNKQLNLNMLLQFTRVIVFQVKTLKKSMSNMEQSETILMHTMFSM